MTALFKKDDKVEGRFSRTLPESKFMFQGSLHIYNGKVCFYSVKKDDLSAVIVENKNIHDTLLALFKAAWELAAEIGWFGFNLPIVQYVWCMYVAPVGN